MATAAYPRTSSICTAAARSPLADDALAAHFTGRGPWKKRLPQIVETLVSLGRARRVDGGVIGAS